MAATTVLLAVGTGLQALGMYQQGVAAAAEAKSQAVVAEYNARVQEQEAKAAEAQAKFRQKREAEDAARYASSMRAGMGASGLVSSEGTPLLIQAKQAAESELDNLIIGYEGQVRSGQAMSQARLDRLQGSIYKQRARSAMTAGYVGAGTTLLTGFGGMWR